MDGTVDSMCSLLVSTKIYSYEGGEVITTPFDPPSTADLFVFVRANLCCRDELEECFGPVCSHCACECQESVEGQYPLCMDCRADGVSPLLKRKRKMAASF